MFIALFAAAHLAQASLPGTQTPPAAEPAQVVRTQGDARDAASGEDATPPQRVCRMEPVTGSRFPIRVCRGARNVSDNQTDSRETLRRLQVLPDRQSGG